MKPLNIDAAHEFHQIEPVVLSEMMRRAEGELDDALSEGRPITLEGLRAIQESVQVWAQIAAQQEAHIEALKDQNARLKGVLHTAGKLPDEVFTGNVVLLGTAR